MLDKYGEREHPHLAPNIRREGIQFFTSKYGVGCRLSVELFNQVEEVPPQFLAL